MKTKSLLFATICSALFFSACGNEDEPMGNISNKQFTVRLKTDFDLVATRATAPSEGNENVVSNTKILLYNDGGSLIGSKDITSPLTAGDLTVSLDGSATTDDVKSVYVLGNLTVGGDDVFKTDVADFTSKVNVDNSHITVSADGMQNESALLPYAGVGTIADGAATVNLKRKAARLTIKNETNEEISYKVENASTSFGGYMDEAKVTDEAPAGLVDIPATTIAASKMTQKLYLLPNTSTTDKPMLKVTVAGAEKALDLNIEANKAYTYTVRKLSSTDVTVTVSVDDVWADSTEGDLNFGDAAASRVSANLAAREYIQAVTLPAGITSAAGLTATGTQFSVTFINGSADNAGQVVAMVTPVRPYVTAQVSESIDVTKDGIIVATIDAKQDAWQFGEVTFGSVTFMDRDLGALSTSDSEGELFALGSLIPVDQSNAGAINSPKKANFIGKGRILQNAYRALPFNTSTPWFTTGGAKNNSTDPCPEGWHIAKLSDFEVLFTSGNDNTSGNTDGNNATSGALNVSISYNQAQRKTTVTAPSPMNATTVFNANSSFLNGEDWHIPADINSWPTGWWTSAKTADNSKYYNLAFNFVNSGSAPFRTQLRPNYEVQLIGKKALQIRCVKD